MTSIKQIITLANAEDLPDFGRMRGMYSACHYGWSRTTTSPLTEMGNKTFEYIQYFITKNGNSDLKKVDYVRLINNLFKYFQSGPVQKLIEWPTTRRSLVEHVRKTPFSDWILAKLDRAHGAACRDALVKDVKHTKNGYDWYKAGLKNPPSFAKATLQAIRNIKEEEAEAVASNDIAAKGQGQLLNKAAERVYGQVQKQSEARANIANQLRGLSHDMVMDELEEYGRNEL